MFPFLLTLALVGHCAFPLPSLESSLSRLASLPFFTDVCLMGRLRKESQLPEWVGVCEADQRPSSCCLLSFGRSIVFVINDGSESHFLIFFCGLLPRFLTGGRGNLTNDVGRSGGFRNESKLPQRSIEAADDHLLSDVRWHSSTTILGDPDCWLGCREEIATSGSEGPLLGLVTRIPSFLLFLNSSISSLTVLTLSGLFLFPGDNCRLGRFKKESQLPERDHLLGS